MEQHCRDFLGCCFTDSDIAPTLRIGDSLGSCTASWGEVYPAFLLQTLENELIAPLCLSAETDLRLTIHASQASASDKAEKPQARVVHELMKLVALAPVPIFAILLFHTTTASKEAAVLRAQTLSCRFFVALHSINIRLGSHARKRRKPATRGQSPGQYLPYIGPI